MKLVLAAGILVVMAWKAVAAELPGEKPEVWMMPPASSNGGCLKELFTHPGQWVETRSRIDVLGYADHLRRRGGSFTMSWEVGSR